MKILRRIVMAATYSFNINVIAFWGINYLFTIPTWVYIVAGFMFYAQFFAWGAYSSFDEDWRYKDGFAAFIVVIVSICMALPVIAIYRGDWWQIDNKYFLIYLGALICIAVSISLLSVLLGYRAVSKEMGDDDEN